MARLLMILPGLLLACTGKEPEDATGDGSVDADGDGVTAGADCDDADETRYPGADELCDGVDNDCDDIVDEDAVDASTWFPDADGDGFGDDAGAVLACEAPSGAVAAGGDCDDTDPAYRPDAVEDDCLDPNDYNCDGSVGYDDADGDGHPACEDCDDADADVFPGAAEVCDGDDNDCDDAVDEDAVDAVTWYADQDGDRHGDASSPTLACTAPDDHVLDATDCDDTSSAVHPGATELCNGVDDDCDSTVDEDDAADAPTWYDDADGDGYGDSTLSTRACEAPSDTVGDDTDCDDLSAAVNPGATELCNDIDDDCDGSTDEDDAADAVVWYADSDGDGFGDPTSQATACDAPSGYTDDTSDCDDGSAAISPDADEVCDGIDNDCDGITDGTDSLDAGTWYLDRDGDGHGDPATSTVSCTAPASHVAGGTDCDDTDASISPAAVEYCDTIDNDCDGSTDEDDAADALTWYADSDGDGFGDAASDTTACEQPSGFVGDDADCDDGLSSINPDADEVCDGDDNDCDGTTDEDDAVDALTWYADGDGDGFGDAESPTVACDQPSGYVADDSDCDDGDAGVTDCSFPTFDGTLGTSWTTLATPSDHLYSLQVYQTSDIPVIVNAYSNSSSGAQRYDPATNTWTTDSASVPYNSPWTSMAPWDGDLWMLRNGQVYRYAVATGTWTTVRSTSTSDDLNMTESDEFGVIYGYDDRGYIIEYDTVTGSVTLNPTGVGGEHETRLAYDPGTRAIYFGAYNAPNLYKYDIATGAVSAMASIPESQLNDIFCSDRSGHIYAAGGSSGTTLFQYDIASNSWSRIPDLPSDHGNNGSCTVSADGWLYVGTGSNLMFYRIELY